MEQRQHGGGKKAKLDTPAAALKQEVKEGVEGGAATAIVVAAAEEGNTFRTRINVSFVKAKLDCPLCTRPLKPPIFQCDAGHLACSACHVNLIGLASSKKCPICGLDGSFGRNPNLEDFILSAAMPCPNEAYGCSSHVAYVELDNHCRACRCGPCCCPERGCLFVGSPSMLIDHIVAEHSGHHRPVVTARYGQEVEITVTAALRWRALVGQDHSLFVVSLGASGQDTAVSLVCVRANATAAAAPQYWSRLGVKVWGGDGDDGEEVVVMESKMRSSAMPGERAGPDERAFVGLHHPLPLDATVAISIRIDQLQTAGAAAAGATPAKSSPATTPRARSSSRMRH